MELEFDKEIDAILRKVWSGIGTSVKAGHLDADTIAAFAENALPERAKLLYMEHFADCDRCRRQLSQSIAMNRGADAAAASTVLATPEAESIPWYATLFKTQNLAIAMGSLVLVFSAVLGLMLLQRQGENAANNAAVSQATEPDAGHGPYYSESGSDAVNTNAAPALNAANKMSTNVAPNTIGSASNTAPSATFGSVGRTATAEEKNAVDDKAFVLDGITGGAPKAAAPAGAPPPVDQPKTERDNKLRSGEDEKAKEKDLSRAESQDSRSRMDREAMPLSLKKVGPTRAGPLNSAQQQSNNSVYDMSVTRSVGGKTFANRSGAWYDTAYSGQSTIMIRRGSDDFKKLDGGLRSIANELYGTVIVVWKGKAYRIQ